MLIDTELKAFGNSIGMHHLRFNEAGCLKLMLGQNRTIFLEKVEEHLFCFIVKTYELSPLPFAIYAKALALPVQYGYAPFPVQAIAKTDHDVGFFTKIPENQCDQPTLYRLLKYLIFCSESLDEL
jgi:hypothetical protein